MRPVVRGNRPLDSSGNPKTFKTYQDARGDLIDQLGEYCSYCEARLPSSLAVEHILPKFQFPDETTNWENFCLACTNCNSTKGSAIAKRWDSSWQYLSVNSAKRAARSEFYWPDRDNTFRAIEYLEGGKIKVNPSLAPEEQKIAQATIEMVGLDKIPNLDPKKQDRRWHNRREAWEKAKRSLANLRECDTPKSLEAMRDEIVSRATDKGFWSVWMTVFKNDPDMLQRLINAFPGTCQDCFDELGNPLPRSGGNL